MQKIGWRYASIAVGVDEIPSSSLLRLKNTEEHLSKPQNVQRLNGSILIDVARKKADVHAVRFIDIRAKVAKIFDRVAADILDNEAKGAPLL